MFLGILLVLRFHETPESINIIRHNIISLLVNLDVIERICIVRSEATIENLLLHNSFLSSILIISSCVRNRLRFPVTITSGVKFFNVIDTNALNEIEWRLRLVVIGISIRQSACPGSTRLLR